MARRPGAGEAPRSRANPPEKQLMTANLKLMERHLENTVRAALAAQDRLRKARRAAGISHRRTIYTAAEVKSMRLEWYEQWRGMLRAQHVPTYKRMAEVAIGALKSAKAAE